MAYLLAINCGSSSIKGKLYHLPGSKEEPLNDAASLSVSNISSKGEKIKIKIQWNGEEGKDVNEEGEDGGDVECELAKPLMEMVLIDR
jgi:acetate kinase